MNSFARLALPLLLVSLVPCTFACTLSGSTLGGLGGEPEATGSLRVGDFVVYRYSGLFSPDPVTLRMEVLSREGDAIEIEYLMGRGEERRQWIEILDVGLEREFPTLKALFEVVDGQRVSRPTSDQNQMLEWSRPQLDGFPREMRPAATVTLRIAGKPHECEVSRGTGQVDGQAISISTFQCPLFPWWNPGSEMVFVETGRPFHVMEVVDYSR